MPARPASAGRRERAGGARAATTSRAQRYDVDGSRVALANSTRALLQRRTSGTPREGPCTAYAGTLSDNLSGNRVSASTQTACGAALLAGALWAGAYMAVGTLLGSPPPAMGSQSTTFLWSGSMSRRSGEWCRGSRRTCKRFSGVRSRPRPRPWPWSAQAKRRCGSGQERARERNE